MNEPLDLEPIKGGMTSAPHAFDAVHRALLAEVERLRDQLEQVTDQAEARGIEAHAAGDFVVTLTEDLDSARAELSKRDSSIKHLRGEVARQAEQITAVRALHSGHSERSYGIFPCATIEALDGTS